MLKLALLEIIRDDLMKELQVKEMDDRFKAEVVRLADMTARIKAVVEEIKG